ncbi:hypothetical protein ACS0TY_024179 [Phlomoides rotata]
MVDGGSIWYCSVNRLVQVVVETMSGVFPELKEHTTKIREINIADEEASFGRTLTKGIERFKKDIQELQGKVLSGEASG